jgi:hypothetical protein
VQFSEQLAGGDPQLASDIDAALGHLEVSERVRCLERAESYVRDNRLRAEDVSSHTYRNMVMRIVREGAEAEPAPASTDTEENLRAVVTPVSAVAVKPIEWLWYARIQLGVITFLEGDPGTGKSTVLLDIAARVTRGIRHPHTDGPGEQPEPRTVVLLSAEDDPGAVIRPRLEAAGADISRVMLVQMSERGETREPVIVDADVAQLEAVIEKHRAALLVIDPLVAYLPNGTDTNEDHSVRRVLGRLKGLAERTGCAIVCVRHWRKGSSDNALYRGGGSIGFIAAARGGLVVGMDPNDQERKRRVFAVSKVQYATFPPSLEFTLEVEPTATFPVVRWGDISRHDANALTGEQKRTKQEHACGFLEERLADGAVPSKELESEAAQIGISGITYRRARRALGIVAVKASEGDAWLSTLPRGDRNGTDA